MEIYFVNQSVKFKLQEEKPNASINATKDQTKFDFLDDSDEDSFKDTDYLLYQFLRLFRSEKS